MSFKRKLQFVHPHFDASESVLIAREMTRVRTALYSEQFAPLKGRALVPTNHEMAPSDRFFEYWQITPTGMAEFITDYGADLARVDMFMSSKTARVRDLGAAYGFNLNELERVARSRVSLSQQKPLIARQVVDQKADVIVLFGDTAQGLLGLLNQPNATEYVIPNGVSTHPDWERKTPEEIFADMSGICNGIFTSTKEVERPNTLLLPLTSFTLISRTRMWSNGSSEMTVLQWFLKMCKESVGTGMADIADVVPLNSLETAGAGSTKRMIAYRNDASKLELLVPREFTQLPPVVQNLEAVTNCIMTIGGVVLYVPMSMAFADTI